jgi:hypothetical protein
MTNRTRTVIATAVAAIGLLAAAPAASAEPTSATEENFLLCTPVFAFGTGEPNQCVVQILGGVLGSGVHNQTSPASGCGSGCTAPAPTTSNAAVCGPLTSASAGAPNLCHIDIIGGLLASGTHQQ